MKSVLVLLFLVQTAFADSTPDQEAIRQVHRNLQEAINSVDVEKTVALMDDRLVFINIPGDVAYGRAGIRKYFDYMLLAKNHLLRSAQFNSEITGDPVVTQDGRFAVVHGVSMDHYVFAGGGKLSIPVTWSASMTKESGEWRIISFQAAANVFQNPLINKIYTGFGVVAAILLVLASVIFYRLGRRRSGKA